MLQETLNVLRRQFLGLNRVLSTMMELVTDGLLFDDEDALLHFAARLLINNHNFQFCTIHRVKDKNLHLSCAISTDALLDSDITSEAESPWVSTCEHLASQVIDRGDGQLLKRQTDDSIYYSMTIMYREEILATLTVNSPSFDDNHAKLISIFCHILSGIIMNTRQNQNLTQEVLNRTEQLESAWQIAEQSSKAKSQFLTNMSHEYLTPLNVIVGSSTLVSETQLTTEQRDYIDAILQSSEKLQSMVHDMLEFSQSETGEMVIKRDVTHLPTLLKRVHETFLDDATRKGLKFELLVADDLPEYVLIDVQRIEKILGNLVSNAIKFTESGRVTIDTYCETGSQRDAIINFSVLDTGIGIEADNIASIFDAFHQIDASDSRRYQGTGLGLAISQRIAKLMGSEIHVSSKPGSGSRFSIVLTLPIEGLNLDSWDLPLNTLTLNSDPNAFNQEEEELNHLSVLLVEDNIVNQKLAARLLEKLGCKVDVADDGFNAIEMFGKESYDLIFMDCQMPNMDGFEATARIREMESGKRTPIIALTANSLPEDRAKSYKAGMDEYLTKPIIKEKLHHALIKWTRS